MIWKAFKKTVYLKKTVYNDYNLKERVLPTGVKTSEKSSEFCPNKTYSQNHCLMTGCKIANGPNPTHDQDLYKNMHVQKRKYIQTYFTSIAINRVNYQ